MDCLLVDLENIMPVASKKSPNWHKTEMFVFVGAHQACLTVERIEQFQQIARKVEYIRVPIQGSNALDFVLSFHLGKIVSEKKYRRFLILSKDKGYDALVRHLCDTGMLVSRIESVHFLLTGEETPSELIIRAQDSFCGELIEAWRVVDSLQVARNFYDSCRIRVLQQYSNPKRDTFPKSMSALRRDVASSIRNVARPTSVVEAHVDATVLLIVDEIHRAKRLEFADWFSKINK